MHTAPILLEYSGLFSAQLQQICWQDHIPIINVSLYLPCHERASCRKYCANSFADRQRAAQEEHQARIHQLQQEKEHVQRDQQLRVQHEQREQQQQHDLEHQLAESQNQIHELTQRLEATQSESNALRQETTLLRQRAQTLTTAHEEMREKLALSADGLSESMREARYCWKGYELKTR